MSFGLPYMGSKSKYAVKILDAIGSRHESRVLTWDRPNIMATTGSTRATEHLFILKK